MHLEEDKSAKRLYIAFTQFKRLKWKHKPIEGLRFSEIPVLNCIRDSEKGFLSISEISNTLDLTSPTVTQMVNNLEKKGLVERQVADHDRRVVEVLLTNLGCKVLKEADDRLLRNFNGIANYLGGEDTLTLANLMEKIYKYFNEIEK